MLDTQQGLLDLPKQGLISVGEVGRAGKAKTSQWLVEEYSEHRKKGDIRKHSLERQNFKSRSHLFHI